MGGCGFGFGVCGGLGFGNRGLGLGLGLDVCGLVSTTSRTMLLSSYPYTSHTDNNAHHNTRSPTVSP